MKQRAKRLICVLSICMMTVAVLPTSIYAKAQSSGKYPTRAGTILVTPDKYKGLIPTGHAAIVQNKNYVIESLSNGVGRHKNNWVGRKSKIYGVTVKGTSAAQDKAAYSWCASKIGKKYNYNYYNVSTRKKFYCSQLVWAAFKDKYRIDLNTKAFGAAVHPMELVNTSKTNIIYRYSK